MMAVDISYHIGQFNFEAPQPGMDAARVAPDWALASIDLRGLDGASPDVGFFVGPPDLTGDTPTTSFLGRGDYRAISADARPLGTLTCREIWAGHTKVTLDVATTLYGLIWDQLTYGSDPEYGFPTPPLQPRADGTLELVVGPHREVIEPAEPAAVKARVGRGRERRRNPWTSLQSTRGYRVYRDKLRRTYRDFMSRVIVDLEDSEKPAITESVAQRALGGLVAKYRPRGGWRELLHARDRSKLRGPKDPTTTYREEFAGEPDGAPDPAKWTSTGGQVYAVENGVCYSQSGGGAFRPLRYNTAMSVADMSAEVQFGNASSHQVNVQMGGVIRDNGATVSALGLACGPWSSVCYFTAYLPGPTHIFTIPITDAPGTITRLSANGSTIEGYVSAPEGTNAVTNTQVPLSLGSGWNSYYNSTSSKTGVVYVEMIDFPPAPTFSPAFEYASRNRTV